MAATVEQGAPVAAPRVAAALRERAEELAQLWERLDRLGPTYGDSGDDDHWRGMTRDGYLRPVARMLADALDGSAVHRAVYLDERLRYVPQGIAADERLALIRDGLAAEVPAVAELVADRSPVAETVAALEALHAPLLREPQPGDPRLLLMGDCVIADLRMFLGTAFADRTGGRGLYADHLSFNAGWRTLDPEDIARAAAAAPPDLVGLSLFTYEAIPAYRALLMDAGTLRGAKLRERVAQLVDMLRADVEAIREVTDATVIVHTACSLPIGRRRVRYRFLPVESRGRRRLIDEMTAQISELADAMENVLVVDEDALVRRAGGARAVGGRLLGPEYLGAYAHPTRFGEVLAAEYADVLHSVTLLKRAKALLVDFDNTLWSGVMGEGDVVHDRDGQRLLRRLKEAGVLLVALSKNDPGAIRWDEMELAPDDFVLQAINWRPKPDNVAEAIAALDLAPDAFVLLDDNPVERALVGENVPGVAALDPTDPFAWRSLERWLAMPSTKQTEEARRRTEMYREAAARRDAMSGGHDYTAMMRSLELRADVRPATEDDMPRLLELVQRTNQFNTTTRRRSADEVRALLRSPVHDVHVASLGDRFGDLGVVCVVIVDRSDPAAPVLDSFIMSCRAMGFGFEQLVVHEVLAGVPDATTWIAPFITTDRNGPAAGLYPGLGFTETSPGTWTLGPGDARPERPAWFA